MQGPALWKDDLGASVDLSMMSPALVGLRLKEGAQRFHERELARKLGIPA